MDKTAMMWLHWTEKYTPTTEQLGKQTQHHVTVSVASDGTKWWCQDEDHYRDSNFKSETKKLDPKTIIY